MKEQTYVMYHKSDSCTTNVIGFEDKNEADAFRCGIYAATRVLGEDMVASIFDCEQCLSCSKLTLSAGCFENHSFCKEKDLSPFCGDCEFFVEKES